MKTYENPPVKILYEDSFLIICEKPVGLASQYADGSDSLPERLLKYLGEDAYVGVVHRLDVGTGGVIIYAKNRDISQKLSDMISQRKYKKEYLAVIDGKIADDKGILHDFLYHDKGKNKSYVVKGSRKGAKEAKLEYTVLSETVFGEKAKSLVRINLLTGWTHQIRVQFAHAGHPVCGDGKYGSRDNRCSCALWAHRCEFVHPVTGVTVEAVSCPPDKYPWNLFDI